MKKAWQVACCHQPAPQSTSGKFAGTLPSPEVAIRQIGLALHCFHVYIYVCWREGEGLQLEAGLALRGLAMPPFAVYSPEAHFATHLDPGIVMVEEQQW